MAGGEGGLRGKRSAGTFGAVLDVSTALRDVFRRICDYNTRTPRRSDDDRVGNDEWGPRCIGMMKTNGTRDRRRGFLLFSCTVVVSNEKQNPN